MTCSIEGCEGQVRSRSWCRSHYERWRRTGDPTHVAGRTGGRKAAPLTANRTCKICNETQPIANYYKNSKGWTYLHCKSCHSDLNTANRIKKRMENPPQPREKVDHGECDYDGCTNKAQVTLKGGPEGWYCKNHWYQWDKNKELRPIRKQKRSYIDERFRLCTTCERVKTQDQFHDRSGGRGKQSRCKACQHKSTRFSIMFREGRLEEALSVAETMAEGVREKYLTKVSNAIAESELERSNG